MNGSRSPDAALAQPQLLSVDGDSRSASELWQPSDNQRSNDGQLADSAARSIGSSNNTNGDTVNALPMQRKPAVNGDEQDAESEAETLIESPVKRREAEQQAQRVKRESMDKPRVGRIGSLPVPQDDSAEDAEDADADAAGSPMDESEMEAAMAASSAGRKDNVAQVDADSDKENSSDALSDVGSNSSMSQSSSRASSRSRALSERPDLARHGAQSPNPRKRKHRASSVSLPNKRLSDGPTRRRLRGLHSEDNPGLDVKEGSQSPKLRSHKRAASTQSAFLDGAAESGGRKRRAATQQFPVRDPKSTVTAKPGWDQSSISSESTSHGQAEHRRPQRGVGRSTSTPGRPLGREHKRHINKYGFTRLAEACEVGDMDLIKEWREKDPDQLELPEFAGNTPLQIAALAGNAEVVEYLIGEGCKIDCANVDKDTPLIDAAENGHLEVVELLLKAGVDPLRQNLKGQQALDVIDDETENATEVRAALRNAVAEWNSDDAKLQRQEEEERRYRAGPSKELHFMARTYENLLKLVTINDRNGVREFLDARVPVDNAIIAAAARTGDQYLINMLLAEMTEKKAYQKPEKPMLSVLGTSHFEMVKSLTQLDQFNPLWRSRQGKTWAEIAEERSGSNWRQEKDLFQRLYDEASKGISRQSSSPVSKRDSGKRRLVKPESEEDESGADDAPKRKNGRRLMSRRDMRAASGKNHSDSSGEEASTSDTAGAADESMKPPESPSSKRAMVRKRTKSMSSQPAELSPRLRRRSSSLRGPLDMALPSLDENMEDAATTGDLELEQTAQHAIGQAEQSDAEHNKTNGVEAEAKRMEDEHRAAERARQAAVLRGEEEAQRESEEKNAAERRHREAQEAEERKEREAREAEEARRIEEQRKRREAEIEHQQREEEVRLTQAKREQRQRLLSALPSALCYVLDPNSDFAYDGEQDLSAVLRNFTPLQAVPYSDFVPNGALGLPSDELLVMNAQAAPLLGKEGLELLFPKGTPAFEGSWSQTWQQLVMDERERESLNLSLPGHTLCEYSLEQHELAIDEHVSFEDDKAHIERRGEQAVEARRMLYHDAMALRWVRLQDVMDNLHPLLKKSFIEVRCDWRGVLYHERVAKIAAVHEQDDFVDNLNSIWHEAVSPQVWVDGANLRAKMRIARLETTDVVVVHEK